MPMNRRLFSIVAVCAAVLFVQGCSTGQHAASPGAETQRAEPSPAPLPSGSEGALISLGRDIIEHTGSRMPGYTRARMSCEACHVAAGTKAHGGSFVGIYATFPQWNKRARRYIALQDRLAECFLYSMNGRPPAYSSREMIALVAYIAFLSRGTPVGSTTRTMGLERVVTGRAPNVAAGARVYAQTCAACHGSNGEGVGGRPPLWGAHSFNDGAGMHRVTTMAGFVRYNMPFGSPPDTLSKQDALDVSAFILSHARPRFNRHTTIAFPPLPASYF